MGLKQRVRNLFVPNSDKSYKLSRSRLENFLRCPRCFYLDRRLGIDRPSMPAFNLNIAVDHLLKKEFDRYRAQGQPHPDLDTWRENFKGLQVHHKATNLIITGAIDDLWVDPKGQLIVVDYKATSKDGEVTLDDEWKDAYKRQMEIYQWLLRNMGHDVSDTGYFVYANGRKDMPGFDGVLCFRISVIPYKGNAQWVEKTILEAHECLSREEMPPAL